MIVSLIHLLNLEQSVWTVQVGKLIRAQIQQDFCNILFGWKMAVISPKTFNPRQAVD